jgi:hypothetical protein
MSKSALRAAAFALAGCLPVAAHAAETLTGVCALPDGRPRVGATLVATPGRSGVKMLDIAMTRLGKQHPVAKYETELSKHLHVIAVSSDFRTFVHEHADRPAANGQFRVAVRLPRLGLYHVYADGVPSGIGQQFMRLVLNVGGAPVQPRPSAPTPAPLEPADGRYAARFDPFELRAGQESQLSLHLSRDAKPPADVTPFLGVAAHAVFIGTADLTYVRVHVTPAAAQDTGAPLQRNLAGTAAAAPAGNQGIAGMDLPDGDAMPPLLRAGVLVSPNLTLHLLAPKAGTYLLWTQFTTAGKVRTMPFSVAVA